MRVFLLLLVFAVASNSYGQPQQKSSAHQQHTKAEKFGSKNNPIFVDVLPPKDAATRADEDQKDREAKRKSEDELVKFTAQLADYTKDLAKYTGVLIAVGIVQCLIFVSQFGAFVYQGVQLKKTVDSSETSSMPFLYPIIAYQNLTPREPPHIGLDFFNYGKTPATVRSGHATLFWTARPLPKTPQKMKAGININRFLVPAGRHSGVPLLLPSNDKISSQEFIWVDVVPPLIRFYIVGEIIYDDFFGTRTTQEFCLQIFPLVPLSRPSGSSAYHKITRSKAVDQQTYDDD